MFGEPQEHRMAPSFASYAVPLATFVLGAILTLFWKRYDKRATIIATYVRELSDCANDWYNQIYELKIARSDLTPVEFEKREEYYVRNRLVLPKYLRALNALRRYEEAGPLVS